MYVFDHTLTLFQVFYFASSCFEDCFSINHTIRIYYFLVLENRNIQNSKNERVRVRNAWPCKRRNTEHTTFVLTSIYGDSWYKRTICSSLRDICCPFPRPVKADLQNFILNKCCKVPNNCFVNSLCFLLNIKILQRQFFLQQHI